jgi:hypothetical protein
MKRLAIALMLVVAVMLTDAVAAQGQTERTRVTFTLTSDTCSKLPPGTTIKASGRQTSVTTTTTDASGVKTIVNYTRARGTARDQRQRRYTFDYINSFSVSNTTANPAQYTGTMFDQFDLVRRGRTTLANGFVALYTTDLAELNTYQPLYAFGDPIGFPEGTPHCDPL